MAGAHGRGVAVGPGVLPGRPAAMSASASHPHGLRVAQGRPCHTSRPSGTRAAGGRPGPPAGCEGPSGRRITAESDPKDPHADADGNGILSIFRIYKSRTAPQANWQYQNIRLTITVQIVPGFAMWTPLGAVSKPPDWSDGLAGSSRCRGWLSPVACIRQNRKLLAVACRLC